MANIQTSLSIPTQPWEAAKARFLEGLTTEEASRFTSATLENLFYDASSAQKKHTGGSRSWIMQERLASLADGLEDYGKALDVYSNASSLILCPIWGSLRVVLHIASEAGKFQEKVVDMLAHIGDAIPRFRIYQALFGRHERLLSALTDAYLDVLRFCTRTKDFFKRAKKSLIPLSIILQSSWKPFRQEFDADMIRFHKHQKSVEKEASLAHKIEAAKAREIELAQRMEGDRRRQRFNILTALRTVDYETKHAKLSSLRYIGTNIWVQNNKTYQRWLGSRLSTCLPCYGIPGSGKSVLAASVIDTLADNLDTGSVLCYYYCDYTDADSLDSSYIIASLIKQLLLRLPLERINNDLDCPFKDGRPPPTARASRNFLDRLLREFETVFFVIDALDELSPEHQNYALELIAHFLCTSTPTVKIFVTSRAEERSIKLSLKAHKSIDLSIPEVEQDISMFIAEMVDKRAVDQNPILKSSKIKEEVVTTLARGAKGMFLWAKFQLYEISEALSESAVRDALDNLPKDLGETYHRILVKAYDLGGTPRINLMKKIFLWIACARRPLRIEELEEAVALERTDTYLHQDRIAAGAGDRLVTACGNLVTFHIDDGTVDFAHHTVKQFLTFTTRIEAPAFNIDPASHEVGELCIAYLMFSDFETQLVKRATSLSLNSEEADQLIWSHVPLGKQLKSLVSRKPSRMQPGKGPSTGSLRFTVPLESNNSDTFARKYTLLEYVVAYWAFHVASLTQQHPSSWHRFVELALNRQLPFQIRPWTRQDHRTRVESCLASMPAHAFQQHRLWPGKPVDVDSTQYLESICLYSWALGHGIRSLLRLSINRHVEYYLLQVCVNINADQNEALKTLVIHKNLRQFLQSSSNPRLGFWDPCNLLSVLGDVPWPLTDREKDRLIKLLRLEFQRWNYLEDTSFDSLLLAALSVSLQKLPARSSPFLGNSSSAWSVLARSYVHNADTLRQLVILSAKHGFTGSNHVCMLYQNLRDFRNDSSPHSEMDLELFFALYQLLPALEAIRKEDCEAVDIFDSMSTFLSHHAWLLVLLSLLFSRYGSLVDRLIRFFPSDHWSLRVRLPRNDWSQYELGQEHLYNRLAAVEDLNLLGVAFMRAETTGNAYGLRLCKLSSSPDIIEDCENSGVQCLLFAMQWHLPGQNLFDDLWPSYAKYIKKENFAGVTEDILLGAMRCAIRQLEQRHDIVEAGTSLDDCSKVFGLPWPSETVGRLLRSAEFQKSSHLQELGTMTLLAGQPIHAIG